MIPEMLLMFCMFALALSWHAFYVREKVSALEVDMKIRDAVQQAQAQGYFVRDEDGPRRLTLADFQAGDPLASLRTLEEQPWDAEEPDEIEGPDGELLTTVSLDDF